jgi:hypothetical protein
MHRAHIAGETVQRTTDVALVGTSFHLGADWAVTNDCSFSDINAIAQKFLEDNWSTCFKTEIAHLSTAQKQLYDMLAVFWNKLLDRILDEEVLGTEIQFSLKVFEDRSRVIYLAGTRDVDTVQRTWDYKTSTNTEGWKHWKVSRYKIQHVVYCWARDQAALDANPPTNNPKLTIGYEDTDQLVPFTYAVINRETAQIGLVEITPTVADARFLLVEILRMCQAMEYLPRDQWPIKPDDWHCSPKWCDNWNNCRGKLLGPDPWGLLAKTPEYAIPTPEIDYTKTLEDSIVNIREGYVDGEIVEEPF